MYTIKRYGVQTAGTSVMPAFKPCFEEPNTFDRWIRRPSNLLHKMKGLLPLAPLWEKFLKGHEGPYRSIFIRCPTFEVKFPPSSVFHRRQIPSQVCECLR
ncbi:hypothetical protein OIU74_025077 [Salix koriyanagi]|uniref:Uncharacterized protein n=1 Tax=Salix koriyanagi TaxID=2511006 RepID=A0A9Q0W0D2_9ROSI|nr:hypothetical protein OIU74_025077 [Salix koriyanagi]